MAQKLKLEQSLFVCPTTAALFEFESGVFVVSPKGKNNALNRGDFIRFFVCDFCSGAAFRDEVCNLEEMQES